MKSRKNNSPASIKLQRYQLKIEAEEYALVLALREAGLQLKSLNRNCGLESEPGTEDEKEMWATKSNYYGQKLKTVRESLGRLRAGKFGICESCGDELGEKRLAAIPSALYCLECQEAYERESARSRSALQA